MIAPRLVVCGRGHEHVFAKQCRVCKREQEAARRRRTREAMKPVVRELPPPAVQPISPFMLSASDLKVERDASLERQRKIMEPILAKVRAMMAQESEMDVTGGLSFAQGRRFQYKRVRCGACGTTFYRKRRGRPAKLCTECRR